MKRCKVCKKNKNESEFYPNRRSSDKLQYECKACNQRRVSNYRILCKKQGLMNYSQRTRQRLRFSVLQHYGGVKPACECCGENHLEFLSIDHIKGGGAKHKKLLGAGFYDWLKKNNFPKGYRVLCHNCNQALGAYGYCPHKNPDARPYCPPKRIYHNHFGRKSKKNIPS